MLRSKQGVSTDSLTQMAACHQMMAIAVKQQVLRGSSPGQGTVIVALFLPFPAFFQRGKGRVEGQFQVQNVRQPLTPTLSPFKVEWGEGEFNCDAVRA